MEQLLQRLATESLHVIDRVLILDDYIPINISSKNKELQKIDVSSSTEWQHYIEAYLKKNNAKVAYGGYLEVRDIYKRSAYFNTEKEEPRNIHLGIDFWCKAGTKVVSVLDGEIHSFNNNKNFGDYGPTIIVKHFVEGTTFYSLYGHLSLESIENIFVGQKVEKGQEIARLGEASVNGDYAPHLHFQIIKNMGDYKGDYPGVCAKKDITFYKENCPNPAILLGLPF